MRKIIYLLLILAFIPLVNALDECSGKMNIDEVPCYILLTVNTTLTPCNTIDVAIYNYSQNLYNQTMNDLHFFKCNATFNISQVGSYQFFYSTGDSGTIIVKGGNKMELLMYFAMTLTFILLIIGLWLRDKTLLNISGILLFVIGVFIAINGFGVLNNMLSNTVAIICWAVGAYVMIKTNIEEIQEILNSIKD